MENIAVIKFQVNTGAQSWQTCAFQFNDVVLSDKNGNSLSYQKLTINNGSFKVISRILGDANGEKLVNVGDGRITVSYVVAIINLAIGMPS